MNFRLCILWSATYLGVGDLKLLAGIGDLCDILIDSGGFSNYTIDKRIRNEQTVGLAMRHVSLAYYVPLCQWLDEYVWGYISLDVVADPITTKANLDAMLDAGLRPIPVVVHGDSDQRIQELSEVNPWLCVASGRTKVRLYQVNELAPENKVHALGFSQYPAIFHLPLDALDVSSWCSGGQFGVLMRIDRDTGAFDQSNWGELTDPKRSVAHRGSWFQTLTEDYGVPIDMLKRKANYYTPRGICARSGTFAHLMMAQALAQVGRRYFFSTTNSSWLRALISLIQAADFEAGTFDYVRAREIDLEVGEWKDLDRQILWIRHVLTNHTRHEAIL